MCRHIRRLFTVCCSRSRGGTLARGVAAAALAALALASPLACSVPNRFSASTQPSSEVVVEPAAAVPARSAEQQRDLNRRLIVAAFEGNTAEVRRLLAGGAWGDA